MTIMSITWALILIGCGDEDTAGANACGGCPQGYHCVGGPEGSYCQYSDLDQRPNADDSDEQPLPGQQSPNQTGLEDEADSPYAGLAGGMDTSNEDTEDEIPPLPGALSPTGPEGCTEVHLSLKPSPGSIPRVMLVVDRSYSMIVEEDRWSPIENTLSRVTDSLRDTVQFGLVLFPSPEPDFRGSEAEMACSPGELNVAPGQNTAEEISQWLALQPPEPGLATPTYSALDAAGRALMANPTGNDYILLATDGGPGCNFGLNYTACSCLNHSCLLGLPEMCLDDQRTVDKVGDLARDGIKTIVLGIASEEFMPESRAVLDRMAVAGETALDGQHFEVNRVDDLEERLTAAAGQLAPCSYDLGPMAEYADELTITIDGEAVPRDQSHRDGWDISEGAVHFYGDACASLRDGFAHQIGALCQ